MCGIEVVRADGLEVMLQCIVVRRTGLEMGLTLDIDDLEVQLGVTGWLTAMHLFGVLGDKKITSWPGVVLVEI